MQRPPGPPGGGRGPKPSPLAPLQAAAGPDASFQAKHEDAAQQLQRPPPAAAVAGEAGIEGEVEGAAAGTMAATILYDLQFQSSTLVHTLRGEVQVAPRQQLQGADSSPGPVGQRRPLSAPDVAPGSGGRQRSPPAAAKSGRTKRRASDTEAVPHQRTRIPPSSGVEGNPAVPTPPRLPAAPLQHPAGLDPLPIMGLDMQATEPAMSGGELGQQLAHAAQVQLNQYFLLYGQGGAQNPNAGMHGMPGPQPNPPLRLPAPYQHMYAPLQQPLGQRSGGPMQMFPPVATLDELQRQQVLAAAMNAQPPRLARGSSAESSSPGETVEGGQPENNRVAAISSLPGPSRGGASPRPARGTPNRKKNNQQEPQRREKKDISKNPKYMGLADRIMRIATEAGSNGFLESAIRDPSVLGNNPDTSVALRWLISQGKVVRTGGGGRPDPYRYFLTANAPQQAAQGAQGAPVPQALPEPLPQQVVPPGFHPSQAALLQLAEQAALRSISRSSGDTHTR